MAKHMIISGQVQGVGGEFLFCQYFQMVTQTSVDWQIIGY